MKKYKVFVTVILNAEGSNDATEQVDEALYPWEIESISSEVKLDH